MEMTLEESLDIFATYEDNWDGDNANGILSETIANVKDVLKNLSPMYYQKVSLYDLFPTPNGTMTIELDIDGESRKYFVIDIGKSKILYYYRYLNKLKGLNFAIDYKGLETVKEIEILLNSFYDERD